MKRFQRLMHFAQGILTLWCLICGVFGNVPIGADPAQNASSETQLHGSETEVVEGWMLINKLGCFQCHQGSPKWLNVLPAFDAPLIHGSGNRLQSSYVKRWLEHPQSMQPGTRMPSLLHGLPPDQRKEITQALTAFLWQQTAGSNQTESQPMGDAPKGEALFKSIGCAACHARLDDTLSENHPLTHLKEKYTPTGLIQFLLQPQSIRPGFHMPDFQLTRSDAEHLTAYLTGDVSHATQKLSIDVESALKGRDWFEQFQCHQCHTSHTPNLSPIPTSPNILTKQMDTGCLADTPQTGIPWYDLTTDARHQIRAALENVAAPDITSKLNRVEVYMKALRCDACHVREDLEGPKDIHRTFFTTSGEDLEDEGRFPPHLHGVGRKLRRDALEKTIRGKLPVRPYMNTRMPNFGERHAAVLAQALAESDQDPDEKPTPRNGQENQVGRNMWGRALIGIHGLGCIQCHPLNGHRSLGIQAMDLKHVAERLRAPWFRDYLLNPARFRPGTRMPAFWPDGKPSVRGYGGTTERQIDSLWVYLNELDQSRLPEGMEQEDDFKLIPDKKPIVFRTFMEDAGLHAIAVGFPASYHVAFDATACQWALAWKGDFLSAESTWHDRFTPLAAPLGSRLEWFPRLNLPGKPDGAGTMLLKDRNRFRGYQLNAQSVPTFTYETEPGKTIRDRITARPDGLVREMAFTGFDRAPDILIFSSPNIKNHRNSMFQSQDKTTIELIRGTAKIRSADTVDQLWGIPLSENKQLYLEYRIREDLP